MDARYVEADEVVVNGEDEDEELITLSNNEHADAREIYRMMCALKIEQRKDGKCVVSTTLWI